MKKRGKMKRFIRDPAIMDYMRSRSGQMQLSFGMIFSIILIIVFLAFGFYAIMKFLDLQKSIQIESFLRDFQNDVDKMWKSPQGSQNLIYSLPANINSVCFKNNELQNLEFVSEQFVKGKMIEHLDNAKITQDENPYCIPNIKGKINMTIAKDYGEILVKIER